MSAGKKGPRVENTLTLYYANDYVDRCAGTTDPVSYGICIGSRQALNINVTISQCYSFWFLQLQLLDGYKILVAD